MTLRDEVIAKITATHGEAAAAIIARRIIDGATLTVVGQELGMSPVLVRQAEAKVVREADDRLFEALTAAATAARPFKWAGGVERQRSAR